MIFHIIIYCILLSIIVKQDRKYRQLKKVNEFLRGQTIRTNKGVLPFINEVFKGGD
jgi:hypothetical protein